MSYRVLIVVFATLVSGCVSGGDTMFSSEGGPSETSKAEPAAKAKASPADQSSKDLKNPDAPSGGSVSGLH